MPILTALSRGDVLAECAISMPWLFGSWSCAAYGHYVPAILCSFMFFLTGLRQVHNAYHYALGLSRRATEMVMFMLSILMLGSMHAVQINHLRHHKHCMSDDDIEALSARMPWWKALLFGPVFPVMMHLKAWQVGTRKLRRWMMAELAGNAIWLYLIFFEFRLTWLQYHAIFMMTGHCFTAFFAVWTVHHDCEPDGLFARTLRNRFKNFVTYSMFYHMEHHLFPSVPTRKLKRLADRIDRVAPECSRKRVF
ncbi:MAG: fatty acid desaturase [Verrucomicrobiota bacterium]